MDTSEAYIKMCEKAEEIQADYNYRRRHYPIYCPDNAGYLFDGEYSYLYRHKLGNYAIWLPRQDQLQEMVLDKIHRFPWHWLASAFGSWADEWSTTNKDENTGVDIFDEEGDKKTYRMLRLELDSMEQLWLAFVMKEKYNKVWAGEDWVS